MRSYRNFRTRTSRTKMHGLSNVRAYEGDWTRIRRTLKKSRVERWCRWVGLSTKWAYLSGKDTRKTRTRNVLLKTGWWARSGHDLFRYRCVDTNFRGGPYARQYTSCKAVTRCLRGSPAGSKPAVQANALFECTFALWTCSKCLFENV